MEAEHPTVGTHNVHAFWPEFGKGLAVTALIVVLMHLVEHTHLGRWLHLTAYDFIQFRLRADVEPKDLPVVVLDIRDLPGGGAHDTPTALTPRRNLEDLLGGLRQARAAAVAVDIDFSPDLGQTLSESDRSFLEFCLAKGKEGMPVYVAVRRRIDQPAAEWLGECAFEPLAMNAEIPRGIEFAEVEHSNEGIADEGASVGVREMPLYIQLNGNKPLPSLSNVLARDPGQSESFKQPPWFLRWAVTRFSDFRVVAQDGREWRTELFLVDYGTLEIIESQTVRAATASDLGAQTAKIDGKRVIIGDASVEQADLHNVPDRRRGVPGVFVHACAAWTLGKSPIYKVTLWGRAVIDFTLAVVLLVTILKGGPILACHWPHFHERSVELWASRLVCLLAFVFGVLLVRWTSLVWDSFVFVIPGVYYHAPIYRALDRYVFTPVWSAYNNLRKLIVRLK